MGMSERVGPKTEDEGLGVRNSLDGRNNCA